ncbi:hypothetical protein SARC_02452 [Sphaeroforma arctica JP610]|uniref:15-cis-phytoene synthase n=1 Tax=Sphaeroforma arctica JP610 TaxID=667725 RepID=A0A0L0G8M4_9EUKA|nr:hypothetical protein SARC_02452 [Sphaeroforma arctica JP610]KNC85360.1 hypothetical protein SARC_02452 [Sphaeroforma arctica JP610]|eukprot:XP_014159262.1 hypothetical protein SARC_02452 [Sphaeroforma arctica JP610]
MNFIAARSCRGSLLPLQNIPVCVSAASPQVNSIRGVLRRNRRCASAISSSTYCQDLVRKHDAEHFLSSLWLPADIRQAVFAIRAFNIEVAQIREVTSEIQIARIRSQWWRDSLGFVYENAKDPGHPVLKELAKAVHTHQLNRRWLERLIREREKRFDESGFMSMDEVEDYSEGINSSLLYLSLQCVGVSDIHADHAASHLGKTEGIITLLRGVQYHARRRKVFLPMDQLLAAGVSQEEVIRQQNEAAITEVAYTISSQANSHLEMAREHTNDVAPRAKRVLLPAVAADMFLTRLQKEHFNLYSKTLDAPHASLPFRLLSKAWSRAY